MLSCPSCLFNACQATPASLSMQEMPAKTLCENPRLRKGNAVKCIASLKGARRHVLKRWISIKRNDRSQAEASLRVLDWKYSIAFLDPLS